MASAPDQEEIRSSFKTHANYLDAFAMCCRAPYRSTASPFGPQLQEDLPVLAKYAGASPTMGGNVAGGAALDADAVLRSLTNAWGAELILGIASGLELEDELVRQMNNWGAVQAYYCAYHGFQALLLAQCQPRPTTHAKTQKMFSAQWTERHLDLPPFSCAVGSGGFVNGGMAPEAITLDIHNWTTSDPRTCWSLAGKAMRSTRNEKLHDARKARRILNQKNARKAWIEEEQERIDKGRKPRKVPDFPLPHLKSAEKADVQQRLRNVTMLDYLYRLRIKTNYVDALMFIDGPQEATESLRVRQNLIAITASTMLLHELHVGALVGKELLIGWADAWITRNDPGALTVGMRRDLLAANL